jgi:hypothetical protein
MSMAKRRPLLWALAWALAITGAPVPASAGDAVTVVELFTSQGCNACPPADALLIDLAEMQETDDLIVLGFHVNYWDYLGWADTFADETTTDRQRAYMDPFALRSVYTPQIVVDGLAQIPGSDRGAVMEAITAAQGNAMITAATPVLNPQEDGLYVRLDRAPLEGEADVWIVLYDNLHDVEVLRGENAGTTLSYVNVVRRFERLGTWNGDPVDFSLAGNVLDPAFDNCVVIVQMAGNGPILGALLIHISGNN